MQANEEEYKCCICHNPTKIEDLTSIESKLQQNNLVVSEEIGHLMAESQPPIFTPHFLHPSLLGNMQTVNICPKCHRHALELVSKRRFMSGR